MAFGDVCKGIYVTTLLLSFIKNQGPTGNWKKNFLTDCVFFNNIFAYFPVTNSKEKISFNTVCLLCVEPASLFKI